MNLEIKSLHRDIRTERMNDHFLKIHLGDGTVIHQFTAADGPHADFHDHGQWGFWSTILEGGYVEEILNTDTHQIETIERRQGERFWIDNGHTHRIIHLTAPVTITYIEPEEHRGVRENWYQFRDDGLWSRNGNDEWRWHSPRT